MTTDSGIIKELENFRKELSAYSDYEQLFAKLSPASQKIIAEELYLEALREVCPRFVVDEFNRPIIDLIVLWLNRAGDFETLSPTYSLDKGLMLLGGVGSGKTVLMRGLVKPMIKLGLLSKGDFNRIPELATYELTDKYSQDGVSVFDSCHGKGCGRFIRTTSESVFIDDFGAEAISAHFGQVTNVVGEIILRRYDNKALTLGTSNLDQNTLQKFYGPRVWSRMKEMFNFLILRGGDRRK